MTTTFSIATHSCSTLSDFFDQVARVIERPVGTDRAPALLWRGQGDAEWHLWPGLQVELQHEPAKIIAIEAKMAAEFQEAAPFLLPSNPDNAWTRLSMAQHYGLCTRLLDWTVNPTVALWFALATPRRSDAAVWAFRPSMNNLANAQTYKSSPFEVRKTTIFRPIAHSARVAAQAGWHTVHKFMPDKGLLAIDRMRTHTPHLTKLVIPRPRRAKLLSALENSGISVTTVFGDLASLCAHINGKYSV